jgi:hypothetical protein
LKANAVDSPALLLAHLDRVRTLPEVATPTTPTVEPTTRMQDGAIALVRTGSEPRPSPEPPRNANDPAHATPARRSFFDRFRSLFALE